MERFAEAGFGKSAAVIRGSIEESEAVIDGEVNGALTFRQVDTAEFIA